MIDYQNMSAPEIADALRNGKFRLSDFTADDLMAMIKKLNAGRGELSDKHQTEMSIANDFIKGFKQLALDFVKHSSLNGEDTRYACYLLGVHLAGSIALAFKAENGAAAEGITAEEVQLMTGDMRNLVVAGMLSEILVGQKLKIIGVDASVFREMAEKIMEVPVGGSAAEKAAEVIDIATRATTARASAAA